VEVSQHEGHATSVALVLVLGSGQRVPVAPPDEQGRWRVAPGVHLGFEQEGDEQAHVLRITSGESITVATRSEED